MHGNDSAKLGKLFVESDYKERNKVMKRIGSLKKQKQQQQQQQQQPPGKPYTSYYGDDDEDSMQSESVYTEGVGSVRRLESDDSDNNSFASSIASNGLFLDFGFKPHAIGNKNVTSTVVSIASGGDLDTIKASNNADALNLSKHDIESNPTKQNILILLGKKTGKEIVSDTSSSSIDTSKNERSIDRGPLAWYTNSSRRFKFAFFTTLVLFVVVMVLVLLVFLVLPRTSDGGDSVDGVESNSFGENNTITEPTLVPDKPEQTPTKSPACQDSEETFLLNGVERTCEWLSENLATRIIACRPTGVAYNICLEACDVCN